MSRTCEAHAPRIRIQTCRNNTGSVPPFPSPIAWRTGLLGREPADSEKAVAVPLRAARYDLASRAGCATAPCRAD
jgi:hypothetical protein